MRAVVKFTRGPGETRLVSVPEPQPGPGQVKIRVAAAGVCGSDVRMFDSDMGKSRFRPPVVLGHEGAGIVVAVGPGVTRLQPGDPVVAETTFAHCGHCRYCIVGAYNQCPDRRGLGSGADGFFAEYTVIRHESVHRIPDGVSLEAAALMEPLACVTHLMLERAPVRVNQTAVIFGPGPLGLLAVQVARACGARPILVGTRRSAHRLALGRELGAAETLVDGEEDVPAAVRELTGGEGADVAYEVAGSETALTGAVLSVRKQGLVGVGAADLEVVSMDIRRLFFSEINIASALSSTPQSWRMALQLVGAGQVRTEPLITHRYPLEEWEAAYECVRSRAGIKVLLRPDLAH